MLFCVTDICIEILLHSLGKEYYRGSITVPLSDLDKSALQIRTKIVSCHTFDSKPVKQELNGTGILSPLVFPGLGCSVCTGHHVPVQF
jgi:hypothetical protein